MSVEITDINEQVIAHWLVEKFAYKLSVATSEVDTDLLFSEFGVDSTETMLLAGELEDWLGFELAPTAMWYHPTISRLAVYIAEECKRSE